MSIITKSTVALLGDLGRRARWKTVSELRLEVMEARVVAKHQHQPNHWQTLPNNFRISRLSITSQSSGRLPLAPPFYTRAIKYLFCSKSLSPALFIEVIPSKAEMALVHLEKLVVQYLLNYIKVPSVYPATWGFY